MNLVHQGLQDQQGLLEDLAEWDLLDSLEKGDHQDLLDQVDHLVQEETMAYGGQLDQGAHEDHLGLQVNLDQEAPQVHQAPKVIEEIEDQLALQDHQGPLAIEDKLDQLENQDLVDQVAPLAPVALLENPAYQGLLDQQDRGGQSLDHLVSQAGLDQQDHLDHLDLKGREVKEDHLAQQDHQVHLDQGGLQDLEVLEVVEVNQDPPGPQDPGDLLDQQDKQDPLVHLV